MDVFRRSVGLEFVNTIHKRQSDSSSSAAEPVSASQLLSTLAPVALIALIWLAVFIVARPRFGYNYSPRATSRLLKQDEQSHPLSPGLFAWFKEFWSVPDTYILARSSLDAYFFLRLLKMSVVICAVSAAMTWPILFPVNATGGGTAKQLDVLTFANISETRRYRYFAHIICMYLVVGFVLVLITRESIYYINLRQAYLMNPAYTRKISSRTVLYVATPDDYLDESRLREILGSGVRRVWYPTDTDKLDDLVEERADAASKLEVSETKLIKKANAARLKAEKSGNKHDLEASPGGVSVDRWLSPKDRPTHRLKFLVGKKVDTVEWCRSELERLTPLIEEEQSLHRSGHAEKVHAVFVEFSTLSEAQAAFQSLTHHQPVKMAPRYIGMHPREIVWSNLRIRGWERFIRITVATAIVVATVIFWSIPVAFIGALSNIKALQEKLPWLNFLNSIPQVIFGVVQGLLPVVLLALLMALLPPFLRFMARLGGAPTKSSIEYTLSNYYFAFQVIQVFLVTTLSSAASAVVQKVIDNPASVVDILSQALPKSNNFYLSYIILQGLGVFSGTLAAVTGIFLKPLLTKLLANTPRKKFLRWNSMRQMGYGAVYPIYTNLLVIAIAYSCVAPLVTGLSVIGLFLFYFAFRYNVIYVYSTGPDTQGLLYPRALQQLFVGLYLSEICMIGLLATALGGGKGAIGPFILAIILLIGTALYHISLNSALSPLLKYLPKTLDAEETKAYRLRSSTTKDQHYGDGSRSSGKSDDTPTLLDVPKHARPNMLVKFLKPQIYCDYATMRRLMPTEVKEADDIDPNLTRDAYLSPSVWDEVSRLVVPRDSVGMSGHEVVESGKVVPITDAGAILDDTNKMVLDEDALAELYFKQKSVRMGYEL